MQDTTTATTAKTWLKKGVRFLWNFSAVIPTCLRSLMRANFPRVEFSRKIWKFKKRKRNSSLYVHVVNKTRNLAIHVLMYQKKVCCTCKVVVLLIKTYRPFRLTQCCTQFKSPGVKILCVLYLHYNVAFTFKWYGNSWNKNVLFPKGLNWIQHWVSQIGLLIFWRSCCCRRSKTLNSQKSWPRTICF